ncbi:hypothetical protein JXB41_01315 [Candidatus Woesearchaeota archaeon]|nr:hypothetical protein [Candidatus Woesearchaeota archaeon]
MTEAIDAKRIADNLEAIRGDLNYIKKHMVEADSIMTEEDYEDLKEYRKEKKSGKLIAHEKVKKEIGL